MDFVTWDTSYVLVMAVKRHSMSKNRLDEIQTDGSFHLEIGFR